MSNDGYSVAVGVDLSEIDPEFRPASQMRLQLDDEAIKAYSESLEHMPPVRLVYDQATGLHWLVDGCHTVHAARLRGRGNILAQVKPGTYLDAFAEASRSNVTHGVRITNADKRHRVEEALKHPAIGGKSNRFIAELCGVGHPFVSSLRPEQLESDSSSKTIGKDGKARRPPRPRTPKPEPLPDPDPVPDPEVEVEVEVEPVGPEEPVPPPARPSPPPAPPGPKGGLPPPPGEPSCSDRWAAVESQLTLHYESWPKEQRSFFVMKLSGFVGRLRALYHPEIKDRSGETLL